MSFDIGDTAEDLLTSWAGHAGVSATEPKHDRKGWDRMLEFPAEDYQAGLELLDRSPPELVCKVQVKATRDPTKRSESIKLDNWERFVKEPIPCFYLIVEYGDSPDPRRVYLVHVGKEWMEKVLRRLREEAAAGTGRKEWPSGASGDTKKTKSLHEKTMVVTWGEEDLLPKNSGKCLAQQIRDIVGDPKEYALRKINWLNTLGYDGHAVEISFSTEVTEAGMEKMADFAIGIVDTLPVSSFVAKDNRFGIPLPLDDKPPEEVVMRDVEVSGLAGSRVTLVASDGLRTISVNCRTRASMFPFPFLPPEHWKVRCSTPFISFIIRAIDSSLKCNFSTGNTTDGVQLSDIAELAEMVGILLQSKGQQVSIKCELGLWSEPVILNGATVAPSLDPNFVLFCEDIARAEMVARFFGLERSLECVPAEVMAQRQQFQLMAALVSPTPLKMQFDCICDAPPEPSDRVAILIAPTAILGDFVLTVFVAITGDWHISDERAVMRLNVEGRPEIVHMETTTRAECENRVTRYLHLERQMKTVSANLEEKHGVDFILYVLDDPRD